MGLPAQALAPQQAELPVWPENMAAVRLFDAGITQWRMGPLRPVGLDYPAVFAIAQRRRLRCRAQDVANLQVMETAALEWFEERVQQQKK